MYRLLLVDDEPVVLDGLREYIDWESLGFQVTGTAQNVSDAMDVIRRGTVDVLLTDIVMDEETGFDLVRRAHQDFPQLKFVILSGYGEFSYALEAIQLGCVSFLTKPVDFDQCAEVFQKLVHILDSEQAALSHQIDLYQLKREKFFRLFLESGREEEPFQTYFPDGEPLYGVLILHFKRSAAVCELQQLDRLFGSFLSRYIFALSSTDFCLLLSRLSGEFIPQLEELYDGCKELKESAYLALGGLTAEYQTLPKLFSQAKEALKYRHLRKWDTVLQYSRLAPVFLASAFDYAGFERRVAQALTERNCADARTAIWNQAARYLEGAEPDFAGLTNLLLSLNRILGAQGLEPFQNDYDAFQTLMKAQNADEAAAFLEGFVDGSLERFQALFPNSGNFIINVALDYMQTHLDERLTLSSLAEVVYVTPTYLSRLFHKVVGKNFADYLAALRVERSKRLLPDPSLKVYEVAALVGYDNAKHFSKVFQDLTGMTPSEYRTSIGQGAAGQ